MFETTLETTSNLVIPSNKWFWQVKQDLLDDLNDITTEQIENMWEELDLVEIKKLLDSIKKNSKKLDFQNATLLIKKFKSSDHKSIILNIIKYVDSQDNPKKSNLILPDGLKWLDKDVALAFWNCKSKNLIDVFFDNINRFSWLDNEVADVFINAGYQENVFKNLDKFNVNKKETILSFIKNWWNPSFENINWLDENFADELINIQAFEILAKNIKYFPGGMDKKIVLKTINAWWGNEIIDLLDDFEWLDKEVAISFLDHWCFDGKDLDILKKFSWLDNGIAIRLISSDKDNKFWHIARIAESPEKFNGLNSEVATKLINTWFAWEVANYLRYYYNLDDKVAIQLINEGIKI